MRIGGRYSSVNSLTVPFWAAARRREFVVQVDETTGRAQFYPRPIGLGSGSQAVRWVTVSGQGRVTAVTSLPSRTGAATRLATVELDESVRVLATLIAEDADARIGTRVRVIWQERSEGPPIFAFVPA